MNRDNQNAKNFWSDTIFAKFYRKFIVSKHIPMRRKIVEIIMSRRTRDVLDIACGPGDLLLHLSKTVPNVNLTGMDIAPGMVKAAQEKLAGKAKILQMSDGDQPFPGNSFDVITITMAFHHFPQQADTLHDIKKLLRQNGLLIIGDTIAKSHIQKRLWNVVERITSFNTGYIGHYTKSEIKALADQAGLKFSVEPIADMPKRYLVCMLEKC
jgi:ubiquinone/menaquinone biosynthesis C-methylase UbiE